MARSANRMVDRVLPGRDVDDPDPGTDRSSPRTVAPSEFTDDVTARARREARHRADAARAEVGARAFELLEEHFPEHAKSRRRRDRLRTFVLGVVVGVVVHHLVGR